MVKQVRSASIDLLVRLKGIAFCSLSVVQKRGERASLSRMQVCMGGLWGSTANDAPLSLLSIFMGSPTGLESLMAEVNDMDRKKKHTFGFITPDLNYFVSLPLTSTETRALPAPF